MLKTKRQWYVLAGLAFFALWAWSGFSSAWQQTAGANGSPTSAPVITAQVKLSTLPSNLPANVRAFLNLALPYAQQAHETLGWQTSVILAQWGLEHGWTVPDAQGYNWGNTTYAPSCPYKAGSRFCYAATPQEGLREYVYTAQLSYYNEVRAAVPGGADAVAVALGESPWDAGHYTVDGHPGDSLLAILHDLGFAQFFDE